MLVEKMGRRHLRLRRRAVTGSRTSGYQASRSQQVLPAAEVTKGVDSLLTRVEDPFMLAPAFSTLGSALDLGRADQFSQATGGYIEVPSPIINPLQFGQSPAVHDQVAQDPPDIFRSAASPSWDLELAGPGDEPLQTILPNFARAINYRFYRLDNTLPYDNSAVVGRDLSSKIVSRMQQLVLRLDNFDGSNLIAFFSFPRLFRSTTNALHQSEGAACTTVPSFLDEPTITVYSAYALSEARFSIPGMVTCSKIVNVLLD